MATTYRIRFNNVEEQAVECNITDETTDLDIIDIEGAEDAIRIVSQNNDEDKFTPPIRAKKCIIKFFNSQDVNLRTFAEGEDNRFLVEVKINGLRVFVGHLEQGDIEEPFQYQQNQIITLTATDGLGSLKNHRLEDFFAIWSDPGPNENRIIDYIASCLATTRLQLNINVINNLREQDHHVTDPDFGNIYAALYLNIKTFEDDKVNKYINCYEVLEKILGHDCFLTQAKGEWWIVRVRELRQDFIQYKTTFDYTGAVLSFDTHNYEKAIGLKDVNNTPFAGTPDASAYFSQDETILSLQRPYKYATLRYRYSKPIEILCNETFERGDFISTLADEVDADGFTLTASSWETECWEYEKNVPPTTQDSEAYVKRLFLNGVEKERFVHMPQTTTSAQYYLRCTQLIPVKLNDKFTLSFTTRFSSDAVAGSSGHFVMRQAWVRLYADDGTFWSLHCVNGSGSQDPSTYWRESTDGPPNWAVNRTFCSFEGEASQVDFTQWISLTFDSSPIPRSGKIEILLLNDQSSSSQEKDFSSLHFEYIPYVNGNYDTFASQSYTSTRDGVYINSIEEEVFIDVSPNIIYKGALLKQGDSGFVSAELFYEGQEFLNEVDGLNNLAPYGLLRVAAFHNQYRNANEKYIMTCQGLGEGQVDGDGFDDHQDLIHRIFNRDIEPATNDKAFQLVNQDVDLRNCQWTGTMIENFNQDIGFVQDDYEFHYETPEEGETTHHGQIPGEEPGPTVGDDIEAAIELVGETWSVTGNNTLATTQAQDNSEHTIWYKWAAPLDGRVNINTSGSNFNTTIRVGTWDGVTFTEIGYNDDAVGTTSTLSSVDFEVTQGVEYYFAIGSSTVDDFGDYVFNMDLDGAGPDAESGSGSGSGSGSDGGCLKFVNVGNTAAVGVSYIDCDGNPVFGVTIAPGVGFCALSIENLGSCGNIIFGGNCENCAPCCLPIIISVTPITEGSS